MDTKQETPLTDGGWTSPPSPPPSKGGWPTFTHPHFPSDTDLHYSSAEVQAWSVGNKMHLKVVNQVKQFFNSQKDHTDDDTDDSQDSGSDTDSDDELGGDYLGVFSKLFEENEELKEYYINSSKKENVEFGCLVCGGVGFIKRFKECVALVQHALTISNAKKKIRAHRDFGHVLCKVLALDINKLPSMAYITTQADNVKVVEVHGTRIATKLKENAPDIKQGSIEASLDFHEAGVGNDNNDVGEDVDGNSAVETKGKQATGDEKLPTSDISNLIQEPCKEDGNGKNASEVNQLGEALLKIEL